MSWKVYGDSYNTDTSFNDGTKTVRFKLNKNAIIKYIRTWIILFNNPNVINMTASIYYDQNNEKGELFCDSLTTHKKTDLITLENGIKSIYFEFDENSFNKDMWYHFAIHGNSVGFSNDSHVAMKTSYPDPVYKEGLAIIFSNLPKFPYEFVVIGDEF